MENFKVEAWQLLLIIGVLLATMIAFVWMAIKVNTISRPEPKGRNSASEAVNEAMSQAFTEDFREELRQRARQQFEKIIHENAMFLQQDVRVSATKLDEFMKQEIYATLQKELSIHSETVNQTRQMLSESVMKSQAQLREELDKEKDARLKQFDDNLARIARKYILSAVVDVITTDQQIALIIDNLNAHKAEIIEDVRNVRQ